DLSELALFALEQCRDFDHQLRSFRKRFAAMFVKGGDRLLQALLDVSVIVRLEFLEFLARGRIDRRDGHAFTVAAVYDRRIIFLPMAGRTSCRLIDLSRGDIARPPKS